MIQAKVIADSISTHGDRLTTIEVEFPRFILAELNKHRSLSNSASSNRAIPVNKIIKRVLEDPVIPVEWGVEQRGMQAHEVLSDDDAVLAEQIWLEARDDAVRHAQRLASIGVHKQITNRLMEAFMWQAVVLTGTYWQNLFNLRAHPDAQPEFRELAYLMRNVYEASTPKPVNYGEWHLPYVTDEEREQYSIDELKQFAVARCARSSYWNQGKINPDSDLDLFFRLISSDPIHSEPTEMVATPIGPLVKPRGNFQGWRQLRHILEDAKGYNSLQ